MLSNLILSSQKARSQFIKKKNNKKRNFRKEAPKSSHSAEQNWMLKVEILSYAFAKLLPANLLVLISTKFINQNILKANDESFWNTLVFPFLHQTLNECLSEGWFEPALYRQPAPPSIFIFFLDLRILTTFFWAYGTNEIRDKHKPKLTRETISSCLDYYKIKLLAVL